MSMMSEFKEFAVKGNVVDLAVGVIIGGAFGKIVASFVEDIVMPPIGLILGGMDFKNLAIVLKAAEGKSAAVLLNYGKFIQTAVDFIIVAFVIFLAIKAINTMKRQEAAAPAAPATPPAPSAQEVLLTEIRDAIRAKK